MIGDENKKRLKECQNVVKKLALADLIIPGSGVLTKKDFVSIEKAIDRFRSMTDDDEVSGYWKEEK